MPSSAAAITAEQMRLVLDVSRMLSVTADLDPLLTYITQSVAALLGCERASIFLYEPATDELWTKVALGLERPRDPHPRRRGHRRGGVPRRTSCCTCPTRTTTRASTAPTTSKTDFRTRNILSAPMVDLERRPVGVVQAINKLARRRRRGADFSGNDRAMLQLLADQAGVAIQRFHLQRSAIESMALRKELDLAKRVQEAMIPKSMPDVPGLDAAGWTKAASVNGGDCFDLWRLPDGRLGILVADASGHGIAPALVVMQARTLIRTLSDTEPDPLRAARPRQRAADRGHGLRPVRHDLPRVPVAGRRARVVQRRPRADPAPPRAGAPLESLEPGLPPIGILDDMGEEASPPVRLDVGGSLVVTSDGITESFSPAEELYGETRLDRDARRLRRRRHLRPRPRHRHRRPPRRHRLARRPRRAEGRPDGGRGRRTS